MKIYISKLLNLRNLLLLLIIIGISFSQGDTIFTPISIPMRDSSYLAADLYSLDTSAAKPTILIQTPYNKQEFRYASLLRETSDTTGLWDFVHYNFVVVDWRGYFASSEAGSTGYDRGLDGYDCVEWIARRSWCDGKVGTWGGSALGVVQFMTIEEHPPHLVCSAPWIADYKNQYSDHYYGGVLRKERSEFLSEMGFWSREMLLSHPTRDAFWQYIARNSDNPEEYDVPMHIVTGWFDKFPDDIIRAFHDLGTMSDSTVRDKHKIIVGPWTHQALGEVRQGQLRYPEAQNVPQQLVGDFFDYYLRDLENGYPREPVGKYFVMEKGEWVSTDDWYSLTDSIDTLYFHAGDSLAFSPPHTSESFDTFHSNPRNPCPVYGGARLDEYASTMGPYDQRDSVESREDVISYSTPPLSRNYTIVGPVTVNIAFSSDALDTDIAVRLCDVYPDGRSMLISQGIRRLRFRNGYTESDVELMSPGEIYNVEIELRNLAMTFKRNHRIRVSIAPSCYPKFALNLNNGGEMYAPGDTIIATNKVYHDSIHRSYILMPKASEVYVNEEENQTEGQLQLGCTPNPFSAYCNIAIEGSMKDRPTKKVSIFDVQGERVFSAQTSKKIFRWKPSQDVMSGVYLVRVYSPYIKKIGIKKVIYIK